MQGERYSYYYAWFYASNVQIQVVVLISILTDSSTKTSSMTISFKTHLVSTLMRSASYTLTDFLAVVGGLLGLFLGISALSIVEFIYYSTLRSFFTIRQSKPENTVKPYSRRNANHVIIDMVNYKRF